MNPLWIWIGALVLYGVFEFGYGNGSGPLSPEEIDDHMARIEAGADDLSVEHWGVGPDPGWSMAGVIQLLLGRS